MVVPVDATYRVCKPRDALRRGRCPASRGSWKRGSERLWHCKRRQTERMAMKAGEDDYNRDGAQVRLISTSCLHRLCTLTLRVGARAVEQGSDLAALARSQAMHTNRLTSHELAVLTQAQAPPFRVASVRMAAPGRMHRIRAGSATHHTVRPSQVHSMPRDQWGPRL
jgi:hypothetical protein